MRINAGPVRNLDPHSVALSGLAGSPCPQRGPLATSRKFPRPQNGPSRAQGATYPNAAAARCLAADVRPTGSAPGWVARGHSRSRRAGVRQRLPGPPAGPRSRSVTSNGLAIARSAAAKLTFMNLGDAPDDERNSKALHSKMLPRFFSTHFSDSWTQNVTMKPGTRSLGLIIRDGYFLLCMSRSALFRLARPQTRIAVGVVLLVPFFGTLADLELR